MGKPLANKIRTPEEFKLLLDTLALDLAKANDYLTLFRSLVDAQTDFWRGMAESPAFWSTAMGALQDAALHGLSRAYDQNDGALTLLTLLETIDSSPPFLVRAAEFDIQQFQADREWVHRDTNQAVRHLMMWRHKFFAHRDPGNVLGALDVWKDYPITWEEINKLLETGFDIVNRYGVAFFQNSFAHDVHGHNDYLLVLKVLQEDAEARYRKLMEEVRRLEQEEKSGDVPPEPSS